MTQLRAYFDYAASTPIDPEIKQYYIDLIEQTWANPNSIHSFGRQSRAILENSRQLISTTLLCKPSEIYFTNSATEANNVVIQSFLKQGRVIISGFEHDSVLEISKGNPNIDITSPSSDGLVKVDAILELVQDDTVLISVMWVNNELGTIQDIQLLSQKLKELNQERAAKGLPRILLHTDGVQAPNCIKIDLQELGADLLTLSAHKIYAPRGATLLFVREGINLEPLIYGGVQESGIWPGTQNALAIGAFAKALEKSQKLENIELIQRFQTKIIEFAGQNGIKVNGSLDSRIPGNVHLSFKNIDQEELLTFLDLHGLAVSAGSSCASGSNKESQAVKYLDLSPEYTAHLRITFGRFTTEDEIVLLLKKLGLVFKKNS